jgi:hypothetical protein
MIAFDVKNVALLSNSSSGMITNPHPYGQGRGMGLTVDHAVGLLPSYVPHVCPIHVCDKVVVIPLSDM